MKQLTSAGWMLLGVLSFTLTAVNAQTVVISEFMASNRHTLADQNGDYSDWIELFNAGPASASLDGWYLTDSTNLLTQWRFPAVAMAPNSYLVVFASAKNRAVAGAELHTNFRLTASGSYLALVLPDGVTVASEFKPEFPAQYRDVSYGLGQIIVTNQFITNGSAARMFVPTNANLALNWTQTAFDDTKWSNGPAPIGFETLTPGFAVTNYKANIDVYSLADAESVVAGPGLQSIVYSENRNVINYRNTGWGANYGNDSTYPGFVMGAEIDNFVIQAVGTITIPEPGTYTFGVNSDDGFKLTIGGFSMAFPNGRGPADSLGAATFAAAGSYPLRLVSFQGNGGAEVEFYAAKGSFSAWNPTNFHLVGDVANGGLAVMAPIVGAGSPAGYRPQIKTDVQKGMLNKNASIYIRIPFVMTNAANLTDLTLRMKYDDGFIAYINGQEVARRNAPTNATWKSAATALHGLPQSLAFEDISLTDRINLLKTGSNLLAIQGLTSATNDSSFFLAAELAEFKVVGAANHYFSTPSPGAPNKTGFYAFVADTKFSVDRGFYDIPFNLEITCATTNATIRYTTNGTPPSLVNGVTYTKPIRVSSTTCIRAAAFANGFEPSTADTHTYLFLADVLRQAPDGKAPAGWPKTWGANVVDYGMDPDVVNNPRYAATIKNDLKAIPSFSIVMDLSDLFDAGKGIYANSGQDGSDWERPTSAELIYPDGTKGFQINCGIRIRGGFSRSTSNPKHAFRLFFREEYGAPKLVYPLFGKNGTDTFDAIDLRTFQNYSWSFQGDVNGVFLRDQVNRDMQLAMGHQGERGDYYHLYINGYYWGLFNTCERPEASYAATYYGGNKENFDVIKVEAGVYRLNATDGNMDAWLRLYNACTNASVFTNNAPYLKLQGLNPDGTRNPAYENLIDVTNMIDYMLIILYGGNLDAPVSWFLSNQRPNNWYGIRDRTGADGFRFFVHDAEHTLLADRLYEDRTGPFPAGDDDVFYSSPQWVWQRFQTNALFRLTVADRIQKHFFNGGVLTTQVCTGMFMARKKEIDRAVVGESARWGDAKRATPMTRDVEWVNAINRLLNNYLPYRTAIVLGQLKAKGLYPDLAAPVFNQHGSNVMPGFQLAMDAADGTVYYTMDGSDPRALGGEISAQAQVYRGPIAINENTIIKSRVWNGIEWSALNDAIFTVIQTFSAADLNPTEIMYHPLGDGLVDGDEFEFVELKNASTNTLDLGGVHFTSGIDFAFTNGAKLGPGQFMVLVSNPQAFTNRYPNVKYDGVYPNRLANNGEKLALAHAVGTPIFTVQFDARAPWPAAADGLGYSLVPVQPEGNADPDNPSNWRASAEVGGSPGADDPPPKVSTVVINEILTNSDPPQVDVIELFNPNDQPVSVGNWFLTDSRQTPKKYRIPAGKTIPAGGYMVFSENDFNPTPGIDPSFTFSSHGEQAYLFSADAAGNLTGFSDGVEFDAAAVGVSFGRYTNSVGYVFFPPQITNTFGSANSGPRVGPVVINEIYYHPVTGRVEFVELKNVTTNAVKLYDPLFPTNTWRLRGGGFTFPQNVEIEPGGLLLIVQGDSAMFRLSNNVSTTVPIFGPLAGALQNNGELLQLQRPEPPEPGTNGTFYVPYVTVDEVRFHDHAPWPATADGGGASLERLVSAAFGNDPINWRASEEGPSPGKESNRRPAINAGSDVSLTVPTLPVTIILRATVLDDGLPNPPGALDITWSQAAGPALAEFLNPKDLTNAVTLPVAGPYVIRLSASDGEYIEYQDVTYNVTQDTLALWKTRYFTPAEQSNPLIGGNDADPDLDGSGNYQEFMSGTNPRNSKSYLKIGLKNASKNPTILQFQAIAGRSYGVLYRDYLDSGVWQKLADVQAEAKDRNVEIMDAVQPAGAQRYYRLVTPAQP